MDLSKNDESIRQRSPFIPDASSMALINSNSASKQSNTTVTAADAEIYFRKNASKVALGTEEIKAMSRHSNYPKIDEVG